MRITLIRPPAYSAGMMGAQRVPLLGIAYIAAVARAAGHDVDIVDMCGEDIDHLERLTGQFYAHGLPIDALKTRLKPSDVIGITCMFSQDWPFHRAIIEKVKALQPNCVFVAGGEHVSAIPEFCLEDCPALDACIAGEGEDPFLEFLKVYDKPGDWPRVRSLVFRGSDGKPVVNPRSERIRTIDELPWPAWDLYPMENYLSRGMNYHIKRGRTIPMMASRGCPYSCTFCSNPAMWTTRWIDRSPKGLVDEMENYVKTYGANNFVFTDLTAIVRQSTIIGICKEIKKRGLDITWQLPTARTEALTPEILDLLNDAGCHDMDFSIESASRQVLEAVGKRNDPDRMASLIKEGVSKGMNFSSNVIIGLPSEGVTDFFITYYFMIKLAFQGMQELNVFPFIPYPGSHLFFEYRKEGKITLNDDYFYRLFGYLDLSKAVSWSPQFGPRTLSTMRFFLMANFYAVMFLSHPSRLLRLVRSVMKGGENATSKLEGVLGRAFSNASTYRRLGGSSALK